MASLTPSQTVLALAMINMFANFGGFVGNYVIGALKQASGNYYGAVWMMGSIMLLASILVAAFPMSWALSGSSEGAGSTSEKGPMQREKSESSNRDIATSNAERAGKCEKGVAAES
jgi:nitrate/nitrite transporter NarK